MHTYNNGFLSCTQFYVFSTAIVKNRSELLHDSVNEIANDLNSSE
jgi:hypothetical protein